MCVVWMYNGYVDIIQVYRIIICIRSIQHICVYNFKFISIYIYIPGTQMTLVLNGKGLLLEGSDCKIEDKQVPGIYTYHQALGFAQRENRLYHGYIICYLICKHLEAF